MWTWMSTNFGGQWNQIGAFGRLNIFWHGWHRRIYRFLLTERLFCVFLRGLVCSSQWLVTVLDSVFIRLNFGHSQIDWYNRICMNGNFKAEYLFHYLDSIAAENRLNSTYLLTLYLSLIKMLPYIFWLTWLKKPIETSLVLACVVYKSISARILL